MDRREPAKGMTASVGRGPVSLSHFMCMRELNALSRILGSEVQILRLGPVSTRLCHAASPVQTNHFSGTQARRRSQTIARRSQEAAAWERSGATASKGSANRNGGSQNGLRHPGCNRRSNAASVGGLIALASAVARRPDKNPPPGRTIEGGFLVTAWETSCTTRV